MRTLEKKPIKSGVISDFPIRFRGNRRQIPVAEVFVVPIVILINPAQAGIVFYLDI